MHPKFYEKEKPVPPEEYVRVDHESLRSWVSKVFQALGLRRDYADIVADNLVAADLMGISSHGVQRIRRYVGGIKVGSINVNPDIRIVRDMGAAVLLDGDNGPGQVVGTKAMNIAIERAKRYGVGVVGVRRSHHYGIAGYYALMAVEHGMIGVSLTNARSLVAYVGTLSKYLGTNPIAVAAPRRNPPPFLFDAATSTVPVGKVEIYAKTGRSVPHGWAVSLEDGRELTGDAAPILEAIRKGRAALLPLGGLAEETGGHKGSGLALIVELLAGVLTGAAWAIHVRNTTDPQPANVGHFFMSINIEAFMSLEEFYDRFEKMIEEIKSLPKHPQADRIWIPGEKAWLTMETRKKIGIPLHRNVFNDLKKLSEELGLDFTVKVLKETA
ncbi:Ldh family oxidoreductase [Hyperthermus butylicus]|uniref:Malate dehydrogenase n=1 Tax=Hyperthermus butylicus (strain DSM 5456 / JCM 9403 / PLM1-5) TaxID=415426 RepID=A2BJM3_HYPBU|nr:Ldh family oxidoreductase [Hyperthermus butylicus]ABM80184.1 Malate dehydrogenase [Hyperthermus butylicus DSM 5456]